MKLVLQALSLLILPSWWMCSWHCSDSQPYDEDFRFLGIVANIESLEQPMLM